MLDWRGLQELGRKAAARAAEISGRASHWAARRLLDQDPGRYKRAAMARLAAADAPGDGEGEAPSKPARASALRRAFSGDWTFPVGFAIVVISLVYGFATYLILNNLTWISPSHEVVLTVLILYGVILVALLAVVAYQLFDLWRAGTRQAAGAGLHIRILSLFSLVAIAPAIILAAFATVSIDNVLDRLFEARVKSIVQNSLDVAYSYVEEHGQVIRSELVGMAEQIETSAKLLEENPEGFQQFFSAQAAIRNIPVAYLLNDKGEKLAVYGDTRSFAEGAPPAGAFERARQGRVVILPPEYTGGVGALKKLSNFENAYLYVIRPVRQDVIRHLQRTRANVEDYARLEQSRGSVKRVFMVMYAAITFTLLLAAVWFGLWFTKWLMAPIRRLIGAAEEVSKGNLNVEVEAEPKQGDLGQLGATFNRMTADLREQRRQLVSANDEIDERRRFIEAVLSGVTAGVIGLDTSGRVTLANRSALDLLRLEGKNLIGQKLDRAAPEFGALLAKASRHARKPLQQNVTIIRDGTERNFAVRVTVEREDQTDYGFVVTFDDISELVTAQRSTAWADVARRIAHEIKNPLTPIQLSAERIRRKYADAITTDREIFDRCTDTIIKHVGDIGRMVDEFSSFARMPKPMMEDHDILEIVREAVILFQMSNPDIKYVVDLPESPIIAQCDRRLITQAVTNLVKNAGEAIAAAQQAAPAGISHQGEIVARVREAAGKLVIEVIDNGCGLPKENRHRLVEPYVTTRQKGTGLGLAIVQRIVEQHGGQLELEDAPGRQGGAAPGALVRIALPHHRAVVPQETGAKAKVKARATQSSGKRPTKRGKEGVTHGV